jgi:hypothetical protein
MSESTRLEKIADDFIETYLRDHPVMIYSLDTELEEYIENIQELKNSITANEIRQEYSKSKKKKTIDEEINNELINAGDKIHDKIHNIEEQSLNAPYRLSDSHNDEESPDTSLLQYMQSAPDPLIYDLMQLVVRNHKIRIRTMHELEDIEQEDLIMPNKWIYHKDLSLSKMKKYIVDYNDTLRKEDEREEKEEEDLK